MKVYVKLASTSASKSDQIDYLHAFTGERAGDGMVRIEDSIIRIGKPDAFFTPEGDRIFIATKAKQRDLDELMSEIVESIFEGYIDIGQVAVHG